jgi:6-phosphofructokinase 2
MVYTITLNPALDRTLYVDTIRHHESNRIEKEERYAGGKGIDVSRVLTNLGVTNKAIGFIGGFDGEEFKGRLLNEGIVNDFIHISEEIRTNIIINERSTGSQFLFNARGPHIKPHELSKFIHSLENLHNPQIVIMSGSLPPGVNPEIYRRVTGIMREKGARVCLDADGDALSVGIRGRPDIIKPNINELSRLVGSPLRTDEEILAAARNVHGQGIHTVLVSQGAQGILLVSETEEYWAVPPEVHVENTIGAGDSAVAGFVYGLISGKDLRESLIYSVAAGTATTLKPGTALCRREDFLKLVPMITMREVA